MRLKRDQTHARETVSAPQFTAASAARESKRHLFVVDSLAKHIQNEKELIRLRPAALHACGANYTRARSAQFRLRRANYLAPGWFKGLQLFAIVHQRLGP